jgi:hypothetical protein
MAGIGCFGLIGRHGSDRVDAFELQLGSVIRWLLFDHGGELSVDRQGRCQWICESELHDVV